MKLSRGRVIAAVFALLTIGTRCWAINALQLGITGGVYDTATDTTIATTNPFTLNAYMNPGKASEVDTYKISMAIMPQIDTGMTLGSFDFSYLGITDTVYVTVDMFYGTPPYEYMVSPIFATSDPNDLGGHGIFDTYFYEFEFKFDSSIFIDPRIDTQNGDTQPGKLYIRSFIFDISNLDSDYNIHFDLYNTKLADLKGNITIDEQVAINLFAPFSHDGQSNGHQVPEPGTMMLLGSGLVGLAGWGRKKFRK